MNEAQLLELLKILNGKSEIIRFEENAPIVFLFDENHDNPNNSIERNIKNAEILIRFANIKIIGVESLAGGVEWDTEKESYIEEVEVDKWYKKTLDEYSSNCTIFSDEISIKNTQLIYGVESTGMHDKIFEVQEKPEKINKLHELRSRHFIKTLSELYTKNDSKGNLILNCGINHNNHIEEWIHNDTIDGVFKVRATYIRINTITE